MPELKQVHMLGPVTALAFVPASFPLPFILAGEGSWLRVIRREIPSLEDSFRVFDAQAIHGIRCEVDTQVESVSLSSLPPLRCLIWGGRSLAVVKLTCENNRQDTQIDISFVARETKLSDWILHGLLTPRNFWTDGFKKPFMQAIVVSARNQLISLHLSQVFESQISLNVHSAVVSFGPPSILYSAHCVWCQDGDVVVAAGSMFGEILVWTCSLSINSAVQGAATQGVVLQSLLGHEGSVFGIHMLLEESTEPARSKYVLATCSDDRTVRLWDIKAVFDKRNSFSKIAEQSSNTGFGSQLPDSTKSCLGSALGHLSRIWSVKLAMTNESEIIAISLGEDATAQVWGLSSNSSAQKLRDDGSASVALQHLKNMAFHYGKHIWASDLSLLPKESPKLVTGGADGRIIIHAPVNDRQVRHWNFSFDKLQSIIPRQLARESSEARKIFDSMKGSWNIDREISSAISSYPSGKFQGTALLEERPPTDKGYDQEMLYSEHGTFTTLQGVTMQGSKRYVYRYQEVSNRITAWFVKLDKENSVDYLFHQVTFDKSQSIGRKISGEALASGYHLCVKDDYNAEYKFPFSGSSLGSWSLKYIVKGPHKDYIASATYSREKNASKRLQESGYSELKDPDTEMGIKAYAWLSRTMMLATNSTGHVLLCDLTNKNVYPDVSDETNRNHFPTMDLRVTAYSGDLNSYSLILSIPGYGALLSGKSGMLWSYSPIEESLDPVKKFDRRIVGMISVNSVDTKFHAVVITILGAREATLLLLKNTAGALSANGTAVVQLNLPQGPNVTSAMFLQEQGLLLIGLRPGTLCVYEIPALEPVRVEMYDPVSITERVHHKDAITSIQLLPSTSADYESPYILTTGRDGYVMVHELIISRTPRTHVALRKVHSMQPPLGPNLEGSIVDPISHELIIWGFRSKDFVFFNLSQQRESFSISCGGAHRSWDFYPTADGADGGSFAWTKASATHVVVQQACSTEVLQKGTHGREIKCIASRKPDDYGRAIIATGSEDTTIRLSMHVQNGNRGLETLSILSVHTTGVQHLQWSADGDYLFSAGGREEFLVWRVRRIPCITVGAVLVGRCPPVTSESSDLRIMDFEVDTREDPQAFQVSMVYSDSTVRIWCYDPRIDTTTSLEAGFELLAKGKYTTNCLTQITTIRVSSLNYILTTATDGCMSLWPSGRYNSTPKPLSLTPISTHFIHQSSIKTLALQQTSQSSFLLATGGDDNALGITQIVLLDNPSDGLRRDDVEFTTLLIPRAHAASITAVSWMPNRKRKLDLVSTSNDQVLKSWEVDADVKGLSVRKGESKSSEVADVACLEVWPGARRTVALGGVGFETWSWM